MTPGPAAASSDEPTRLAARFCTAVSGAVLGGLVLATLAYELRLLRTGAPVGPYPMSVYHLMPAPGTSPVEGAAGAAGADFSQAYTSALALRHGESAYRPASQSFQDRWRRPPGYPPLTNWLVVPLSRLEYASALLAHTALGFLALASASAFVLWRAGLRRHVARVVLTQAALYFLTPIGVTHLERGQFDIWVATAAVLAVGCVFLAGAAPALAAIAGVLGAVKWTALSFLGCFSALGFLLARGRRRWAFLSLPLVSVLATVPFWQGLREYWRTIEVFEILPAPHGLTLQHFLPRAVARALPVALTLAVAAWAALRAGTPEGRAQRLIQASAPFALALMGVSICWGTVSYEYHTVALLGLVPAVVLWIEAAEGVPPRVKAATAIASGLFMVIAFRVYGFGTYFSAIATDGFHGYGTLLGPRAMTAVYAAFAAAFFALALAAVPPRAASRT